MAPSLYYPVFLYSTILLTFIICGKVAGLSYNQIVTRRSSGIFAFILCIIIAYWLGHRPGGPLFGDTYFYAHTYGLFKDGIKIPTVWNERSEYLWTQLMYYSANVFRLDTSTFFTIVALGYFGLMFWACKRWTPNNVLITFLFCLGAFSCYSYGINGIRNGLASSFILLALTFPQGNVKDKIIAVLLAYISINIHRSGILTITMAVLSLYFIKSFKTAYTFWILSILVSLVAGGTMSSIFAGLGFDDKRMSYLTATTDSVYKNFGFRWDFLIYSMMPIILGYYIIIKKGIQDKTYTFLLNTYTLTNAFWVMIIRANYSNRFAYLSWFMYPIVLAYPLLTLDIWGNKQGKRLVQIMLAQIAFTWFMSTLYE